MAARAFGRGVPQKTPAGYAIAGLRDLRPQHLVSCGGGRAEISRQTASAAWPDAPYSADWCRNRTNVTDAGLKHLHLLSKLLDLNLSSTQVTDAGLEHLKSLVHLRELALSETKVNGKDVDALQKALPKVDIIR